jgi:hypothetical protein
LRAISAVLPQEPRLGTGKIVGPVGTVIPAEADDDLAGAGVGDLVAAEADCPGIAARVLGERYPWRCAALRIRFSRAELVEIACERYKFGLGDGGETFAVAKTGPRIALILRGGRTSLRG